MRDTSWLSHPTLRVLRKQRMEFGIYKENSDITTKELKFGRAE